MDPNAIEEDTCSLQAAMVVLPGVAEPQEPPRVSWAFVTAPRRGATVHDVADAFSTAAAHAEERLQQWGASVDISDRAGRRERAAAEKRRAALQAVRHGCECCVL